MAATAFKLLFSGISFYVLLASSALVQDEQRFIYHGFREGNLHLDGLARILPNGLLQLTNTSQLQKGHAFHPSPFKFNINSSQSISFSTHFVLAMVPKSPGFGGHGIAFVISPSLDFSRADATPYLGLFNISTDGQSTNHVLAVEVDTVQSPEFKDIDGNHIGIDVNSMTSIKSVTAAYFSDIERRIITLNLSSGNSFQIWIDYDGATQFINVTLAPVTVIAKPSMPLLSTSIDLSKIFLESMYVGFSASTGTQVSDHYVLGWSFDSNGHAENLDVFDLPRPPPIPLSPRRSSEKPNQIVIALVVAVGAVLITIGVAVYVVRKKKYEEVCEDWERKYGPQRIPYKDLYKATKGFDEKEEIGRGGFGVVYKGVLASTKEQIAVKKITHDAEQGMKEFVSEIVSMERLRHRNLVQLRGYCRRKGELLLVYEYMPNGSLDNILYDDRKPNLNWFQRFKILQGVASGLFYLHFGWEKEVVHRDIKPGNILLDADLNGKLGDFGLARLCDRGGKFQTTKLVGTIGYMAPELIKTGALNKATDVYAFGVFMLEIICGRMPRVVGMLDLVDSVIDCWERGDILEACDERLEGIYVEHQMEMILKLGLFCTHNNAAARPSMSDVMQYLDGNAKMPHIPSDSVVSVFRGDDEASAMLYTSLFGDIHCTMSTVDSIIAEGR